MQNKILRKGLLVGIIVLLIGIGIIPSSGFQIDNKTVIQKSKGNTLYVGGSGSGNYSKIQDAIDNATSGDTVFVYDDSSPYAEDIFINKTINLLGEDKNSTIIGRIYGYNINVDADWVNISGFTIRDGEWGINIEYSNHTNISDNKILNNLFGIAYLSSYNNTLDGNIIMNNTVGIAFGSSCFNTIKNNKIILNKQDGIFASNSSNNIIEFNNISNNFEGLLLFKFNSSLFTHNTISNNSLGFLLCYGSNNIIESNKIINNSGGIYLWENTFNNSIYHNNLINTNYNAKDTCSNAWDDGKYGNYWSDYKDKYPDAKPRIFKPWMWDTPYEINGSSNKDNCPLIKPWSKPKSKDITNSKTTVSSQLYSFLERYTLLQSLLLKLGLQ